MNKPLPPHGSYSRANGSPGYRGACPCEICKRALRLAKKKHRILRARGERRLIDAAQARAHLTLLHITMSWAELVQATGCANDTLIHIYDGRRATINKATEEKILAVKPKTTNARGRYINACGTRRRIHALQVEGHSQKVIAQAADASEENIRLIAAGRNRVRQMLADKIREVYDRLAETPGGDERVARRAAKLGYLPRSVWDNDIDDPEADPFAAAGKEAHAAERARKATAKDQARHLHLVDGIAVPAVAARLGVSERTVYRWRETWGAAA